MSGRTRLIGLTEDELRSFLSELGQPGYRAKQLMDWLYVKRVGSFAEMTNLPLSLRQALDERGSVERRPLLARQRSADGLTSKLLIDVGGQAIETVLMRHDYGNTVCISTQAGCRMGCAFCASTLGGLARDLRPGEMADQLLACGDELPADRVTHVVLMGSGEPLENYANVVAFLRLANNPAAFGISYRRMTLSTCGIVPAIHRLAGEGMPITLAVSLHAPNDALRTELMPVNRRFPLAELIPACAEYARVTGRRVTLEYAMIDGVNDSPREARQLADLVRDFPGHINLIPINPVVERGLRPSGPAAVARFQSILAERGVGATVRREMGGDIDAACGQLRWRAMAAHQSETTETGGKADGSGSSPNRRRPGSPGKSQRR
ncbi:MAG: 23S rRNA (adenine(2503)-C(2))-methyltransferase RlmN [Chloroflexota bacterium]